MDENDWLAERFEEQRSQLRAVAYRMLGSLAEADDAVQDAWVRASRAGTSEVENLGGWLTTIVARVCLNMLRSRNVRREESLEVHLPDPVDQPRGGTRPGGGGTARRLGRPGAPGRPGRPGSRRAPGLRAPRHVRSALRRDRPDGGPIPDCGQAAGEQGPAPGQGRRMPDPDLARQRAVVDAFFSAARGGDFDALVALLHPDVVLRADFGPGRPAASMVVRGAAAVARQARLGRRSGGAAPSGVDQRGRGRRHHAGTASRTSSWPSPSWATGSSKSTSSPTLNACAESPRPSSAAGEARGIRPSGRADAAGATE